MIDITSYRVSIGSFAYAHASREARLSMMFPRAKTGVISLLPFLLIGLTLLRIEFDQGIEQNPGPTGILQLINI